MPKILIVDDSPAQLYSLQKIVEEGGHQTVTADSGEQALEIASDVNPELILMDIVMPGMNGFQATRQIWRGAETRHIPVIIVSSKSQETDKVWGKRQGAKGYLTKPVDTQDLVEAMNDLLKMQAEPDE